MGFIWQSKYYHFKNILVSWYNYNYFYFYSTRFVRSSNMTGEGFILEQRSKKIRNTSLICFVKGLRIVWFFHLPRTSLNFGTYIFKHFQLLIDSLTKKLIKCRHRFITCVLWWTPPPLLHPRLKHTPFPTNESGRC